MRIVLRVALDDWFVGVDIVVATGGRVCDKSFVRLDFDLAMAGNGLAGGLLRACS